VSESKLKSEIAFWVYETEIQFGISLRKVQIYGRSGGIDLDLEI
jgi:hypothetical protein